MTIDPQKVWNLWQSVVLDPNRALEVSQAVKKITGNLQKYDSVGYVVGVPGWVIGVIHYRESNFNFNTYLANGDPLFDRQGNSLRTRHVPAGLGPVRDWVEGAMLSLKHEGWHTGMPWDLVNALINLEKYNGLGYAKMGIPSPYVWAGTNHYSSGKYTSDGYFDPNYVDKQLGCASLAVGLKMNGVDLNEIQPT